MWDSILGLKDNIAGQRQALKRWATQEFPHLSLNKEATCDPFSSNRVFFFYWAHCMSIATPHLMYWCPIPSLFGSRFERCPQGMLFPWVRNSAMTCYTIPTVRFHGKYLIWVSTRLLPQRNTSVSGRSVSSIHSGFTRSLNDMIMPFMEVNWVLLSRITSFTECTLGLHNGNTVKLELSIWA